MGRALELITGQVTAPGATFTAWTLAAGNSLSIRSADINKPIWLVGMWGKNQAAGTLRVRSPRLHDNVQGIRMRVTAASVLPLYPTTPGLSIRQRLITQDTLVVEQTGSAVGGDIEQGSLLVSYEDLPGVAGRFIDADTLYKIGVNVMVQETSHTAGAAGGYSGQVAINSSFDNLKANTDYALIGGLTDTRCTSVRWQGIDTGNLGVGMPGEPTIRDVTGAWFADQSRAYGMPMIPVFNSANKNAILVDVATDENAGTFIVSSILVELPPSAVPGAAVPPR